MTVRDHILVYATACILLALSGCAVEPTYDEQASSRQAAAPQHGRVFFYRIDTEGDWVRPAVRIDGRPVGRAIPNGFFYVDLPPGEYQITASTQTNRYLSLQLAPGDEKYVRVAIRMGQSSWSFRTVNVGPETGKREIRATRYVGVTGAP